LNILFKKQLFNPKDLEVKNDILMEVENNEAEFIINKQKLKVSNLDQQITGYIRIGTYECRAQFENLELINRDTIG